MQTKRKLISFFPALSRTRMAVDIVEMDDLKHILKDTITAICRSRLHSAVYLSVEVRHCQLLKLEDVGTKTRPVYMYSLFDSVSI